MMKRGWHWAIEQLGGQGLFALLIVCVPMAGYIFFCAVWPLLDRALCSAIVIFMGIAMGRMRRDESRKKEAVEAARIEALRIVTRLAREDKGLQAAALEELETIRRGLERRS
jgi:hypothetical protein